MADNHNLDGVQAPVLEETTYDPSKTVKRSLDGIQAPKFEDTSYTPEKKTAGLSDVSAPVLSDTYIPQSPQQSSAAPQYQQYGTGGQINSQQYQQYAAGGQINSQQFQQYAAGGQINSRQYQQYAAGGQINSQQYQQYAAGGQSQSQQFQQYAAGGQSQSQQFQQYAAGGQSQSQQYAAGGQSQSQQFQQYAAGGQSQYQQYTAGGAAQSQQYGSAQSNHALDDVQKPVLDDEPPVQQRYVPKFVDPDVEAAKKQAVDRAIKSSLNSVPESFDEEKSREAYREFMREKEADMAKKGGVTVIFLMIFGLISGLITLLFSFGELKEDAHGVIDAFNTAYMILGIAFMGGSAAMLVKSPTASKAASTIFTFGTILHFIPGIVVMFAKEARGSAMPMYFAVLIINIVICFIYGSNENIKKHYNGHGRDEYY